MPRQPPQGTPLLSRPAALPAEALPPALLAALKEPSVLFPAAEYQLARDLLSVPLPALAIEHDPMGGVVVHLDGQRVPLPACPPLCVAVLAFTEEGEAAMRSALDALPGADAAPAVTRLEPGDTMALAAAVIGASHGLLRRQAGQLASALRSVTQLRAQHEEQQQRLAALEAFVSRDNRQDFDCVFAEAPAEDGTPPLRLGEEAGQHQVAQLLPVASRGVSAIALHLAEAPRSPEAVLVARLTSLEDGRERASWRIPAGELQRGWQVLGLDAALTGLPRTLRLSVEVSAGSLALSLGAVQPLPAFRLEDGDGSAIGRRSLAFKVWAGLPGVMPPLPELDHIEGAVGTAEGFEDVPVTPDRIHIAGATRRALADGALPCQAEAGAVMLGTIPAGLPRGAMLLRAAGLGHEAEFALATGDAAQALALGEAEAPAAAGWSGWIAADPDGVAELRMFCEPDRRAASDLHVLVRGMDGEAVRARLSDIVATVALADAFAQPAADPAEAPAEGAEMLRIGAAEFRGSGFHNLEGAGERSWRWFGRQVSLTLQGAPRGAEAIEMAIVATAPGLTAGSIAATVNGMPAGLTLTGTLQEGGMLARIDIPREARRSDRSLALGLTFGRCHQPPGDGRTLSIAVTDVSVAAE
jgi:hypothetical protein